MQLQEKNKLKQVAEKKKIDLIEQENNQWLDLYDRIKE